MTRFEIAGVGEEARGYGDQISGPMEQNTVSAGKHVRPIN